MKNIIEKILYFFIKKKADKVKESALLETLKAIKEYNNSKERYKKKMSKYSGRKRYQKA